MKRIVCEMCGSTDLIKQDGVFVCQTCGTKYSVEEARKMMVEVEGTVEVTGTVKVDSTESIENFLQMARNAATSSNYTEAENYSNRIIEIDPENAEAWLIKGKAAGWQSTIGNLRFSESIECWTKAYQLATDEQKHDFGPTISKEITALSKALIRLRANNFSKYPSDSNTTGITTSATDILSTIVLLSVKTKIHIETESLSDYMAGELNGAAVEAYRQAIKSFGTSPSEQNRFAYTRWLESVTNCSIVLEKAMVLAKEEALIDLIYRNIKTINDHKIGSKSYKFVASGYSHYVEDTSLTKEAKEYCQSIIDKAKKDRDHKISEIKQKQHEEKEAKKEAYWKNYPEEKERLDKEKAELHQKIAALEEKISEQRDSISLVRKTAQTPLPIKEEVNRLLGEKSELEKTKASIGMFKVREKADIQARIDALMVDLTEKQRLLREENVKREKEIEDKIQSIREIIASLEKQQSSLKDALDAVNAKLDNVP